MRERGILITICATGAILAFLAALVLTAFDSLLYPVPADAIAIVVGCLAAWLAQSFSRRTRIAAVGGMLLYYAISILGCVLVQVSMGGIPKGSHHWLPIAIIVLCVGLVLSSLGSDPICHGQRVD